MPQRSIIFNPEETAPHLIMCFGERHALGGSQTVLLVWLRAHAGSESREPGCLRLTVRTAALLCHAASCFAAVSRLSI